MKRERVELRIVGKRIKFMRESKMITQAKFAESLNVSIDSVKNWEQGYNYPTLEMLIKVADYFNCEVDYLLGRINNKTNQIQAVYDLIGLSEKSIKAIQNQPNLLCDPFIDKESQNENKEFLTFSLHLEGILVRYPELIDDINNALHIQYTKDSPIHTKFKQDEQLSLKCIEIAYKIYIYVTENKKLCSLGQLQLYTFATSFIQKKLSILEGIEQKTMFSENEQ